MGDDGMDPCECIWSHELYMRRLLNIIRNSQSVCTDNECFEDGFPSQVPNQNFLLMSMFFVAALFLFYLRPRAQRLGDDGAKSRGNGNGGPRDPPSTLS